MLLSSLFVSLALTCTCLCLVIQDDANRALVRRDGIANGVDLRILPFGDSLTWGQGSSDGNGYRLELWNKLHPSNHVEYIGNVKSGKMLHNNHEGHQGYDIELIRFGNRAHKPGMPNLEQRPNVVLLLLGTNNIVRNVDTDRAPQFLGQLIHVILKACPDAAVLVAELPPLNDVKWDEKRKQFNKALPGIVKNFAERGQHVALVKSKGLELEHINTYDRVHLLDSGYKILAQNWYEAIKEAGNRGWITPPREPKGRGNEQSKGKEKDHSGEGHDHEPKEQTAKEDVSSTSSSDEKASSLPSEESKPSQVDEPPNIEDEQSIPLPTAAQKDSTEAAKDATFPLDSPPQIKGSKQESFTPPTTPPVPLVARPIYPYVLALVVLAIAFRFRRRIVSMMR